MVRTTSLGACAGALLLCACHIGTEPSRGELGRAEFAWWDGIIGCILGCDAEQAVAVGAQSTLLVLNRQTLPAFSAASDMPSVATIPGPVTDGRITLQAQAAGRTHVVLTDKHSGAVIDRLEIRVRDAASVELAHRDYRERLTIMLGGPALPLGIQLRDGDGDRLRGIGGCTYSVSGSVKQPAAPASGPVSLVDAISQILDGIAKGIGQALSGEGGEGVQVKPVALGSGTIVATARNRVSLQIPVAVVDRTAVTRIEVASKNGPERLDATVTAAVWAGQEKVHSALCSWSIAPADSPVQTDELGDMVRLTAKTPATVQVTCSIGAASATTTVSLD